ncbi:MAG: TPM domain-containing protein [Gilvibacter sp.]
MNEVASFFTPAQEQQIISAIQEVELKTVGEIRVHLEHHSPIPAIERAKEVFSEIGMDKTEHKTGVLIYVAVGSHLLAIVGDEEINDRIPDADWVKHLQQLQNHFVNNDAATGLITTINTIGDELATHFPSQKKNPNELSDDISKGS